MNPKHKMLFEIFDGRVGELEEEHKELRDQILLDWPESKAKGLNQKEAIKYIDRLLGLDNLLYFIGNIHYKQHNVCVFGQEGGLIRKLKAVKMHTRTDPLGTVVMATKDYFSVYAFWTKMGRYDFYDPQLTYNALHWMGVLDKINEER